MKNFFLLLFITASLFRQANAQSVDTVQTYSFGKMPPVYFSDKVYWEKNYDDHNHLLFEGLKYNSCFIGSFINYWDNGKIKTTGQYVQNKTGDWSNLKQRGYCDVKDGTWKNYNEEGVLVKTVIYKAGEIEKEY